jgi:hypothetical protein
VVGPSPPPRATYAPVRIYIGRAVSGTLGERSLEVIQIIERTLRELGVVVLAQRLADPLYRAGQDPPELVGRIMHRELRAADAMVAEVSGPSTGVGYEVGWLTARRRPVLLLYDGNCPPRSALLLAPPEPTIWAAPYFDLLEVGARVRDFVAGAGTAMGARPASKAARRV